MSPWLHPTCRVNPVKTLDNFFVLLKDFLRLKSLITADVDFLCRVLVELLEA